MYGERITGNTARDVEVCQPAPAPPVEPISSIHSNTISTLIDADNALESALTKIRGTQPSEVGKLEKMPESYLLADARRIRHLAGEVYAKTQELHRYLDK